MPAAHQDRLGLPPGLRRHCREWEGSLSRSLGRVAYAHSALWDWVWPVMQFLHSRWCFRSGAKVTPLRRPLPLRPNPLQGLAECSFAHRSCQITLPQSAADPPDLKTAKGKGNQTQLDVTPVQVVQAAVTTSELSHAITPADVMP